MYFCAKLDWREHIHTAIFFSIRARSYMVEAQTLHYCMTVVAAFTTSGRDELAELDVISEQGRHLHIGLTHKLAQRFLRSKCSVGKGGSVSHQKESVPA